MQIEVLQIEDNPGDARLVREMLARVSAVQFSLTHVGLLNEGLKLLAERDFDVILLDLSLPDSHGMETVIKARRDATNVPFVIMSSLDDEELAIKAVQEGAQDYLVKGRVDEDLLVRSIRYAIERKRLLDQIKRTNEELILSSLKEREQAEDARYRAAELDTILDSIADGIVIYDQTGEIVRMNLAAERLLGYSFDHQERLSVGQIAMKLGVQSANGVSLAKGDLPAFRALQGETVQGVLMGITRPEKKIWISVSAAPILTTDGMQNGVVTSFTDMTERIQAELLREEYVSLISHDLRNPLTVLMSQSDWLCRLLKDKDLSQETRSAEAILRNSKRMNAMIQDLVETTRLETGQREMRKEPTDLLRLVSDVVEHVVSVGDRDRILLESPEWGPPVAVDSARIERAITNLIVNALKYAPPESPITVVLRRGKDDVEISVIDRGPGIAPDAQPHLFDRFYRARTGKKTEGLGLGLYIARLIVESHGGRIWVESEYGKGSTFHVSLPLV